MSYIYALEGSSGGYPLASIQEYDEMPKCELCECDATEKVDISPEDHPGRFMADLCAGCAAFERSRVEKEKKTKKL